MTKKTSNNVDSIQKELSDIKRLMVLNLLKDGISQKDIAIALGVSQGTISKMFPGGIASSLKPARNSKG